MCACAVQQRARFPQERRAGPCRSKEKAIAILEHKYAPFKTVRTMRV
jgi:hypothetical protein